jgi:mitochondrial intermediate peptidase
LSKRYPCQALKLCLETTHNPPLSSAEIQLLDTFQRDFEKSGIHLPSSSRKTFVDLSDEIQVLGRKFLGDIANLTMANEDSYDINSAEMIEIPDASSALIGMGAQFIDSLPRGKGLKRGSRFIAPNSWAAQMILRHSRNPDVRRLVYIGSNVYNEQRVAVLEELLIKRGQLAGILGKDCWSEVVLGDKMAKTPGEWRVESFVPRISSPI